MPVDLFGGHVVDRESFENGRRIGIFSVAASATLVMIVLTVGLEEAKDLIEVLGLERYGI